MKWQPPTGQNGSTITGYVVRWGGQGDKSLKTLTLRSDTTIYKLTGLRPGHRYAVGVAALTQKGPGPAAQLLLGSKNTSGYWSSETDDASIVSSMEGKFDQDPRLRARRIRVDSHRGFVAIAGLVTSDAEKDAAEQIARRQRGVKRVIDELVVSSPRAATSTSSIPSGSPNRIGPAPRRPPEPQLIISRLLPSKGPAGGTVIISGTGFTNVTAVTFGGAAAAYTIVSATAIRATVPDVSYADSTIKTLGPGSQVGVTVTVKIASVSANSLFNYTGPPQAREALKRDIRSVDFRNFDYHSGCSEPDRTIRAMNGESRKEGEYYFRVATVVYGDLLGDGHEEAIVHTGCSPMANFSYNNIYIFASSTTGPTLLARLTPSEWGAGEEDNGGFFQVSDIQVGGKQLDVSFYAGGSHAQPAWVDTARFQWNGSKFVRVGLTRKPFSGW